MNTSRLTRRTAAALCTMLLSGLSLAQGFPNKTVTLQVAASLVTVPASKWEMTSTMLL